MDNDDTQLVLTCKKTLPYDTTAFEVLLRRYEPIVFRTCRRYLGNAEDAEEACQDAFIRAFHALPNFEERSTFRTWLFRIVANVCATRWAKLNQLKSERATHLEAAQHELPSECEPKPEQFDDVTGRIGEELERLAAEDRHILVLRHVAELSFSELADSLGIGLSAAKMRLYRAEQRLRVLYEGPGKDSNK